MDYGLDHTLYIKFNHIHIFSVHCVKFVAILMVETPPPGEEMPSWGIKEGFDLREPGAVTALIKSIQETIQQWKEAESGR